jgi:hypothetical protein
MLAEGFPVRVVGGEPSFLSKFPPCSSSAAAVRPQLRKRQGHGSFRFSLFRPRVPLAGHSCASSAPPEAVSHGLWPDSLPLVNGGA